NESGHRRRVGRSPVQASQRRESGVGYPRPLPAYRRAPSETGTASGERQTIFDSLRLHGRRGPETKASRSSSYCSLEIYESSEILTLSATIRSHQDVMDVFVRDRNYFGASSIDQMAPGLIYMLA